MLIRKCVFVNYLFLLFPGIFFAQETLSGLSLKGEVKSVQSIALSYENPIRTSVSGFLDNENFDSVYIEFDKKGNLVLRKNFLDYRGKLGLFDRTLFYFNFSNQIEKQETTLIQNGEEPQKVSQRKAFYYIQNRLARMDEFNSGRTTDQFWVTNFIYEGGRLTRKDFWMEDAVFSRTEISNRLYRIISEKTFHNDGKAGKSVDYTYDENAKLILKSINSGNEHTEESFEYENEKLKTISLKINGKLILNKSLNENGLPIEIEKFNYKTQKFDLYEFKFEYDFHNNWINCVILKNQTPELIMKREINYY